QSLPQFPLPSRGRRHDRDARQRDHEPDLRVRLGRSGRGRLAVRPGPGGRGVPPDPAPVRKQLGRLRAGAATVGRAGLRRSSCVPRVLHLALWFLPPRCVTRMIQTPTTMITISCLTNAAAVIGFISRRDRRGGCWSVLALRSEPAEGYSKRVRIIAIKAPGIL